MTALLHTRTLRAAFTFALAASLAGCGDDAPNPEPPGDDLENEPGADGAPENAGIQSWGVGAKWYDYGENHTVSATDEAWYLVRDDGTWHLSITRYYSNAGDSGHPNMIVHRWNEANSAWTPVGEWVASAKVQTTHQCFKLSAPSDARSGNACNDFDYDVMWRSDLRPIPAAGFAIGNPGFYIATDKGGEVYNVQSRALPANLNVLDTDAAVRILSVFDHDAVSIIEPRFFTEVTDHTNTIVSLTGGKLGAQWRIDEDGDALTLASRCVDIVATSPENAPTFDGDAATLTFNIDEADAWTLVALCTGDGPTIFQTLPDLRPGGWPSNDLFDLAFEKTDEGYVIWMAPEQIMIPVREGNWDPIRMHAFFWEN